jgi:hypothetical protein
VFSFRSMRHPHGTSSSVIHSGCGMQKNGGLFLLSSKHEQRPNHGVTRVTPCCPLHIASRAPRCHLFRDDRDDRADLLSRRDRMSSNEGRDRCPDVFILLTLELNGRTDRRRSLHLALVQQIEPIAMTLTR